MRNKDKRTREYMLIPYEDFVVQNQILFPIFSKQESRPIERKPRDAVISNR